jgi:hypothetical protein
MSTPNIKAYLIAPKGMALVIAKNSGAVSHAGQRRYN